MTTPVTKQQERVKALEQAYRRLFGSNDGKQVLRDLAKHCFVQASTWATGQGRDDVLINEGCRRVFLYLAARIRMDMTQAYLKRDQELGREA